MTLSIPSLNIIDLIMKLSIISLIGTLSRMTLSITSLSIIYLIMELSIIRLIVSLSIMTGSISIIFHNAEFHYAYFCILTLFC
jgi:hypothetical protein